jgi:hypothetical protein
MPYIPLSRIQMNLYTGGGEYAIARTGREYIGYYYKLYTGKVFTGNTPNDAFTEELTPIFASNENTTDPVDNSTVYIALFTGDPDPPLVGDPELFPWNNKNIVQYLRLKGQNPNTIQAKNMIQSYIPQPTPDDYKLGQFYRYFVKKKNENVYKEISQDTYNKVLKSDKTLYSKYYKPFRLLWQISGSETDTGQANRKMTLYAEKTLKIIGLQQFLKEDYTKFYKK